MKYYSGLQLDFKITPVLQAYQLLKKKSSEMSSKAGKKMSLIANEPVVNTLVKNCPPGYMPHDVICGESASSIIINQKWWAFDIYLILEYREKSVC